MEVQHDVVKAPKARYRRLVHVGVGRFRGRRTTPIIGATKIRHLEDAVGALSVHLTEEEVAYLEEPYVPHPIVGHQ